VVDSVTALPSLLDNLTSLPVDPPSPYLGLEGIRVIRHGSISVISLYITPMKKIHPINIHRAGSTAFSITNSNTASLQTILESSTIPKVILDILDIHDSDALFSQYL
jgi:exonuclease 3'-5' domain-containing protein 1